MEPDSEMRQMFKKWHSGNLRQLIKMLKTLEEKIHKMHDQMHNFIRGMEILRKNQKEMLEIKKNTVRDEGCF